MPTALIEAVDAFHQIHSVLKFTRGASRKRGIATKRQNVGDAALRILCQNIFNISVGVVGAREMRNWVKLGLRLQSHNQFVRARARAARRAIGDADKRRL